MEILDKVFAEEDFGYQFYIKRRESMLTMLKQFNFSCSLYARPPLADNFICGFTPVELRQIIKFRRFHAKAV